MSRVLLLATTTGYQTRAFGDAAERLGVQLAFATDRCHMLDDPWRDEAIPVRFYDEDASVAAVLESARRRSLDGVIVRDQKELEGDVARLRPDIALLAVPGDAAQPLVDRLVKSGVRAILNFAPAPLQVPEHVTLRSVNMALELEILSYELVNKRS